jgi:DNA-3-methyladenine glycosylase I
MGAVPGDDGLPRCGWCLGSADYVAYHDDEWGRPVVDDVRLFEKVCLEGFQSGLSWLTILRKREGFRSAFAGFDPERVARFDDADVARLLADAGIVRHRGKIEATIANARATLDVQAELGSLAALIWSHEPDRARPAPTTMGDIASVTPESTALAKDLKRRGFRFVGPTTAYAAMQSLGVVDDHLAGCHSREACEAERLTATVPG